MHNKQMNKSGKFDLSISMNMRALILIIIGYTAVTYIKNQKINFLTEEIEKLKEPKGV